MSLLHQISLTLVLLPALGLTAHAAAPPSTPGVTGLTGAAYDTTAQFDNFSIGYNFTVGTQDVLVTALGYLDDGFGSVHRIGFFDSANAPVGDSAVATAGADGNTARADAANPTFSYTTLTTPIKLSAGQSYTIVGGNYMGGVFLTNGTPTTDSRITYNGSRYSDPSSTDAFQPPAHTGGFGGDFGPNFLLAPAPAVPEASPALSLGLLLVLGGSGLMFRARRRSAAGLSAGKN